MSNRTVRLPPSTHPPSRGPAGGQRAMLDLLHGHLHPCDGETAPEASPEALDANRRRHSVPGLLLLFEIPGGTDELVSLGEAWMGWISGTSNIQATVTVQIWEAYNIPDWCRSLIGVIMFT